MDATTILILGAILLGFGSLGLFVVRSTNRGLKGLGWMGAAFACGACGFGVQLANRLPYAVAVVLPDLVTLAPFVLFQMAVSELSGEPLLPRLGLGLLSGLFVADLLSIRYPVPGRFQIAAISLAVALQCAGTGWQLWQRRRERSSARFCSTLLLAFSTFNLLRATLEAAGLVSRWHIGMPLLLFSFTLFVAVGLGLAFGFFWMSNASFSQHLEEAAGTDSLTRLYNRRAFLRACEKEFCVSARKARPFSILMADLDYFKSINDRFGHLAGDSALIAVVESMQNSIRGIDVLGRWGGEEFVVLLPNASEEAAKIVAERMRANVARLELPMSAGEDGQSDIVKITVSIGLATYQPHDDLQTVLRRADECLYLAKDAGRNRVLQFG